MTTKDKFIRLSFIPSTKREQQQAIIGLTEQGRVFKGITPDHYKQDSHIYVWEEINLPEGFANES